MNSFVFFVPEQTQYYSPQIIQLSNIIKITSSFDLTFFLAKEGVYRCGVTTIVDKDGLAKAIQEKVGLDNLMRFSQTALVSLELIDCDQTFNDAYHNKFINDHGVFIYRENKNAFEKSKYINMVDHYLHEFQSTPTTIHIDNDGYLMVRQYQYDQDEKKLVESFKMIYEQNEFAKQLKVIKPISYGGFGKVLLARDSDSGSEYALKKIWLAKKDRGKDA